MRITIGDELIGPGEVAKYLGLSRSGVINLLVAGEIPAIRVGSLWKVSKREVQAYLDRQQQP
jgi:excisionase family DNA binding protein